MFAAITNLKLKQEHFDRTVSVSKSESYQQRFVKSKGFVKAIYYANKDSDDFGSITVWESKEDFEEYWDSIPEEEKERVNTLTIEPFNQKTYEIIADFAAD